MKKLFIFAVIAIAFAGFLYLYDARVETKLDGEVSLVSGTNIAYFKDVRGHYVEPVDPGVYPGVVLIHEWWGLNDHIREAAEKLASQGYRVLAVDLYNGKVATTTADAQKYRTSINQQETIENLTSAVTFLKNQGAEKIASFGWCFGGGKSLELALSGVDLDATVIYYGQLVTDTEKLKAIEWPVLGIFGDKDTSISTTSVAMFDGALDSLNIQNEIYMYPGVGHAFANPSNPNYAPTETADAWEKTLAFLEKNLK